MSAAIVAALLRQAEQDGLIVEWSDCADCDRPESEHTGRFRRCPTYYRPKPGSVLRGGEDREEPRPES